MAHTYEGKGRIDTGTCMRVRWNSRLTNCKAVVRNTGTYENMLLMFDRLDKERIAAVRLFSSYRETWGSRSEPAIFNSLAIFYHQ